LNPATTLPKSLALIRQVAREVNAKGGPVDLGGSGQPSP